MSFLKEFRLSMNDFYRGNFTLGSRMFLIGIALIYLIAFVSLWLQIEGLFGSEGIMPFERYFERLFKQDTPAAYILRYPSLLWLDHFLKLGNSFLHILCGMGSLLSILALFNYWRGYSLFLCWIFYLSLVVLGSPFLSFQWDNLLLESGFLSIWLAGFKRTDQKPSPFILFTVYLLLFRLMFFSGYVKLASNDPVWWNLSALLLHFETQPLPHALSWYFHQIPPILLKIATALMFFIELVVPFFIFMGRRLRHSAGILFMVFMLVIILSGNYTFFNFLTVVLCLSLFDNEFYRRWLVVLPTRFLKKGNFSLPGKTWSIIQKAICLLIVTLALITEGRRWLPMSQYPVISNIYSFLRPFRSVNTYGLFADMTTTRPEVIFEISADGDNWQELQFKWKPVALDARPRFVQPHQPRLDWQLWFAGLFYERVLALFWQQTGRAPASYDEIHRFIYQRYRQVYSRHVWVHNFMEGILNKSPSVLNLTAHENWPDKPFYCRAWLFDYHFTQIGENTWWQRENKRVLFPQLNNSK